MALNITTLRDAFESQVFGAPVITFAEAGAAWAAAYAPYAAAANSCNGSVPIPATVDAAESVLASALTAAFAGGMNNPAALASNMATAFSAFWVAIGWAPTPGTAVANAVALQSAILGQWVAVPVIYDPAIAAQAHAVVFDTWTRTVAVTHPSICAGPIT